MKYFKIAFICLRHGINPFSSVKKIYKKLLTGLPKLKNNFTLTLV